MIRVFGFLVETGEELGNRGGPEALEELVVLLRADALVDNVGSGAGLGDAVTHERLVYKGEGWLALTEKFPGVPVNIALEI